MKTRLTFALSIVNGFGDLFHLGGECNRLASAGYRADDVL